MTRLLDIYIGHDPREIPAYEVLRFSLQRRTSQPLRITALMLQALRYEGLYSRQHERRDGQLWDVISDAPMATEFAISRFLPIVTQRKGWSVFMDCDFLALEDVAKLFDLADDRYAVMCVQHHHEPPPGAKMDGQMQVRYSRKNWSSLMLINHGHVGNQRLTLDMVNELPGRDLHRFCWLHDHEIGALPKAWNYLVGHTTNCRRPKLIHYTDGYPAMHGYAACEYATEWFREREILAACHAPIGAAA